MPIQLNIYLGKDIVDAQINRLEELQQFFHNQHVVDKEKIAKIQAALRNTTIWLTFLYKNSIYIYSTAYSHNIDISTI